MLARFGTLLPLRAPSRPSPEELLGLVLLAFVFLAASWGRSAGVQHVLSRGTRRPCAGCRVHVARLAESRSESVHSAGGGIAPAGASRSPSLAASRPTVASPQSQKVAPPPAVASPQEDGSRPERRRSRSPPPRAATQPQGERSEEETVAPPTDATMGTREPWPLCQDAKNDFVLRDMLGVVEMAGLDRFGAELGSGWWHKPSKRCGWLHMSYSLARSFGKAYMDALYHQTAEEVDTIMSLQVGHARRLQLTRAQSEARAAAARRAGGVAPTAGSQAAAKQGGADRAAAASGAVPVAGGAAPAGGVAPAAGLQPAAKQGGQPKLKAKELKTQQKTQQAAAAAAPRQATRGADREESEDDPLRDIRSRRNAGNSRLRGKQEGGGK